MAGRMLRHQKRPLMACFETTLVRNREFPSMRKMTFGSIASFRPRACYFRSTQMGATLSDANRQRARWAHGSRVSFQTKNQSGFMDNRLKEGPPRGAARNIQSTLGEPSVGRANLRSFH
jgi:hypothetical protein